MMEQKRNLVCSLLLAIISSLSFDERDKRQTDKNQPHIKDTKEPQVSAKTQEEIKDTPLRQKYVYTQDGQVFPSKDMSTHEVLMEHAVRTTPQVSSSFQMKKMSRREQILSLFVKGVDVSIKDIATRVKGCSEKTIQRELNNLVLDNIVERVGEKRWSRYVLK
jgi:predicted HTH transcriptional regulator